jgi:hypothetical protein
MLPIVIQFLSKDSNDYGSNYSVYITASPNQEPYGYLERSEIRIYESDT